MTNKKIIDDLPKLYHSFLPSFFQKTIPTEIFSSCNNCSMICKSKEKIPTLALKPFNSKTKCCTYYPRIPNFLVGAILSDENINANEGRNRIINSINRKSSVNPKGISAPKIFELLYDEIKKTGFGHSDTMVCPYYETENGNCTIWQYRNSDCSTYFCKHVANEKGKKFWSLLLQYLKFIETSLIDYTLLKLNCEDTILYGVPSEITVEEIDGKPLSDSNYKKIWKNIPHTEQDFYIKSYEIIKNLNNEEFNKIVGVKGEIFLKRLIASYVDMIQIPNKLIKNPFKSFNKINEGEYSIVLERIDVKFNLSVEIIDIFDGKNTNTDNMEFLLGRNVEIDEDLILTLYNYDILIDSTIVE